MPTYGDGPWKEGRAGAASLCYLNPSGPHLAALADMHARVGIRATLATATPGDLGPELVKRNWDLALPSPDADAEVAARLFALDGRPVRGVVCPGAAPLGASAHALYRLSFMPGTLSAAEALPADLPTLAPSTNAEDVMAAVDAVVRQRRWGIWVFGDAALSALGSDGHARLLSWLGGHHGRVWCAPVRDIAAYVRAAFP